MTGLSRENGRLIEAAAHLEQSIRDILTTPKGTRVLLRDYGSRLPDLIDAPINGETLIDVYAETAEALDRWEPRLMLRRIEITVAEAGVLELRLTGEVNGTTTAMETELRS